MEAVVSLDDISVKDVEEENYEDDEDAKQRPEDWDDDDRRWGSSPTVGKPTIVTCNIVIAQLQDLDTVRGTLKVRIGVWCYWTDPRLKGRSRMDPLPTELWSPRVTIDQSLGEFVQRTCELTIGIDHLKEKSTILPGTKEQSRTTRTSTPFHWTPILWSSTSGGTKATRRTGR